MKVAAHHPILSVVGGSLVHMSTATEFDGALDDFFGYDAAGDDRYDRPDRIEDEVPRDRRGKPRILPPDKVMPEAAPSRDRVLRTYGRPSDFAEVVDDHYNLDRWRERRIVEGLMKERRLQLEYANLGDVEESYETKQAANKVIKKMINAARADEKADEGTGVHALTERLDHGLEIKFIPGDFEGNMADWARLTKDFDIRGIEVFVVEDHYRLAGTFDRMFWYHVPCPNCGANLYIGDLKTGKTTWGGLKMGAQLGIYAHGQPYNPSTGERTPLGLNRETGDIEKVCTCRGIIVDIPAGQPEGTGRLRWLNIAQGWNLAVRLAHEIRAARKLDNWWLDFETIPDITPLIMAATTRSELDGLYRLHRAVWTDRHTAMASAVIEQKGLS